ncbi:MAG: LytR/AlgR family response regulator transcription factor [Sphingobacteriales bacterium]|jgi:DNA-binding LytR/AlgR family response regulator
MTQAHQDSKWVNGNQIGTEWPLKVKAFQDTDLEQAESPAEPKQFILVKHDYRTVKIKIEDVLFFEGKGNYVSIYTRDKVIVTLLTMGKLEQILSAYGFFRIHKSYIVSFRHIEAFWNDKLQVNGRNIPIGGQYRDRFQQYLNRFSIPIY